MSTNNRQRRTAKAKQRAKARSRHRSATDGPFTTRHGPGPADTTESNTAAAIGALRRLVVGRMRGRPDPAAESAFARFPPGCRQAAIDDVAVTVIEQAVDGHWTPHDLREVARRRLTAPGSAEYLLGVLAAVTARHDPATVAPEWRAELAGVEPITGCRGWALGHDLAWDAAASQLVELLSIVLGLPRLQPIIPAPGRWRPRADDASHVDERILGKVRGLLAKAESTTFEEEAEALTAKAQELMTAYSIERAVAEADQPAIPRPATRRVWIDAPYVDGKSLLIQQVAAANGCRGVFAKHLGVVTLVGFAADLAFVELLSTSLLLQSSRAMRLAGSHIVNGTSRTRSFRQSFLVAYAARIGERLRASAGATQSVATESHGAAVLPVLAARDDAVADRFAELFPDSVARSVSVSNRAGYGAGRAAADLAQLDAHDGIEQ
ncbi:MAG: DUF2786 domain-containing protein [Gordonia sp. (in: high G+C Gram-positive bacteria)]